MEYDLRASGLTSDIIEKFLTDHWQKRPCLFRGLFAPWEDLVTPDELAGLSCEGIIPARIVRERGGDYAWQARQGPFSQDDFDELGDEAWSLLVQHVNTLVPPVADMMDVFSFLPSWRMEDVMISFAPAGASVGAHIDNYDVFLVQGLGSRRWMIGEQPITHEELADAQDLRLLKDFKADHELVLQSGDVLYIPPRVGHHGIALEDCMTYSVGFRAPTSLDLFSWFGDYLVDLANEDAPRFSDEGRDAVSAPGEISMDSIDRLYELFQSVPSDKEHFKSWLLQHLSQSLVPETVEAGELTQEEFLAELESGRLLRRCEGTRIVLAPVEDGVQTVYANGRQYMISEEMEDLRALLSGTHALDPECLAACYDDEMSVALLFELYRHGDLYLVEE